jgi:acyl-CoA synthetase (AMP-forming)/AMP-acid ligase II
VTTYVVRGEALGAEGKAEPAAPGAEGATRVVQCGGAFEGHDIQVFAPDDAESERPLAERQIGELRLRGPSLTPGYFNDPEITREAFAGGWLRTGDLGYLAGGKVHICGRSKEVIIVNGRNYYPQDLEWEAGRVDGVRKGNVIAFGTMKPHNDRERVILAFETAVSQDDEQQALKGEVRKAVQQALGLTMDDVLAVAAGVLPKTSSGKLQRAKARQLYETGELLGRSSSRELDPIDAAKELVKSQLGFLRHAIFGSSARREE